MKNRQQKKRWDKLYPLLRPYLGNIILLNVLTVLQACAQVAMAVVTRFVIDAALSGKGQLLFWGIALIAILLIMVAMHALTSWCAGSTADKCVAQMRHALLGAAARSREEQLQAYHSGALLSRGMEDVHTVCDGLVSALPSMVGQLTSLVGALIVIMLMYPSVAPILVAAGVVVATVSALVRPVMKKQHGYVRKTDEQVLSSMQENLQQLELIQSLEAEEQILDRFAQWLKESLATRRTRRCWSVGINSTISLASQLGTGALLLWGATQVAAGSLTYGSLTAMLQLLSLFRSPVLGLSGLWTRFAAVDVAGERLMEMLNQEAQQEMPIPQFQRVDAVVFESVTFSYPNDQAPVLENFSAEFPLEQWACLTGISGRGKTTLFKLILGLYVPKKGRVYLRTDCGEIPCGKQTRGLFAYVPQDFALFSGSIRENLLLVAPQADDRRRREALHAAQADFVWDLTHGEMTQVRENNAGLSKGQLQRLAIARAVLMERPVFLLDECTSALDAQTEAELLRCLSSLGKQAILVTHRPEALRQLDGITFVDMEQ